MVRLGDVGLTVKLLNTAPRGIKLRADETEQRGPISGIVFADAIATAYGSICA